MAQHSLRLCSELPAMLLHHLAVFHYSIINPDEHFHRRFVNEIILIRRYLLEVELVGAHVLQRLQILHPELGATVIFQDGRTGFFGEIEELGC